MGNTYVPCHIHLLRFAVQLPTLFCITTPEDVASIPPRNDSNYVPPDNCGFPEDLDIARICLSAE
jgi:hypothetical protein